MNLSSWSVRNPVPTIVTFLALVIAGLISFTQLGIDDTPNIDIPAVIVTVTQPGAGPTELETQVTKKVEDAVAALDNVDEITSTVKDGISTTQVAFVLGTDTDRATNDVRNAISQIRQDLPLDVNDPVIQRLNFSGGAVVTYAVVSPQRSVEELSNLVDRVISRELLTVKGVAQVDRIGGVDREIRVDLNPDRLLAFGITATEVNDQIRALNADLPAGQSEVAGSDRNIRTLGSAPTVESLASYRIVLPSGEDVTLESLGTVEDRFAELKQIARFFSPEALQETADEPDRSELGQPVVAFSVRRSTGSSLVPVEERVRAAIDRLQETLPPDISLQLILTRADATRESYRATRDALIAGSILTVLVVGCFLRDWRPTLITAVALPLSIIPTFITMQMLDYTLNGMTLLALALAMGNLVDDAICMIENIDQHLRMGKSPRQAALDAAREIGLAVIATTATIVGVFVPVAFMGGVPGQFFQPFGFTVAIATMFSTLVAVTMTPMLAAHLLKRKPRLSICTNPRMAVDQVRPQRKLQVYRNLLSWSLRQRVLTIATAIVFFWGSLQLVPLIPKGLFSSSDNGLSIVQVELPPGATLEQTDRTAQQIAAALLENPIVTSIFAQVGNGDSEINTAQVFVNLQPREQRQVSRTGFEAQSRVALQQIPGARISFESQGPGAGGKDLSIILKSENPEALTEVVNALENQMRETKGLVEISSSASLVKPEILIQPDPSRVADLGVSVQTIARTFSLAAIGDTESNLAKFDLPDRQIPIRVQIDPDRRDDLDTLQNLRIPSQNGTLVPLNAVADIQFGSGPAQIDRFNRSRQVTVGANLQGVALGDSYARLQASPVLQNLPADVEEQPFGDAEIMRDIFTRFVGALATGILCIYAVLVLLYNSFLIPLTILTALPLSIGGALLALMITQKELGLFALIGIVLLMGLVTKNAILLVDCAMANEREGLPQFRAVVESGVSRLRPILMTTFSTIAGMLPIAMEWGADAQTRSPMAISVIGGFSTSTLLTLVVVPVIFTYVDTFQSRLMRPFRGEPSESLEPGVTVTAAAPDYSLSKVD